MRVPPYLGACLGLTLAALDYGALTLLGFHLEFGGPTATRAALAFYALTFAGFGHAIEHLLRARATIRAQLDALRASHARVVHAETLASVGRMAAVVAHEVRNPLGILRSSASLVQEGLDPAASDLREAAAFMVEEVDRLDAYVGRLLDLARPITPDRTPTSSDAVFDRAERLAPTTSLRRARGPSVPLWGDEELLARAVLGLLHNAEQAGATTVRLEGGHTDARPTLTVTDDGPGVPETIRARAFEPFVTTRPDGTGLGLAQARRVALAHGGDLHLDSSERGARFVFTLPAPGETPCP